MQNFKHLLANDASLLAIGASFLSAELTAGSNTSTHRPDEVTSDTDETNTPHTTTTEANNTR